MPATFYAELLEAEPAPNWGPFTNISLSGGVMLQFAAPPVKTQMQHYAFSSTTPISTAPTPGSLNTTSSTGPTRR